jgi:DNA-binding CsgD family transcriptional regulator
MFGGDGLARSMSERCRVILRYAYGIASKVVAAALGVDENTADNRI